MIWRRRSWSNSRRIYCPAPITGTFHEGPVTMVIDIHLLPEASGEHSFLNQKSFNRVQGYKMK